MSTNGIRSGGLWGLRMLALALLLTVPAPVTFGQEEGAPTATVEAPADEAPASDAAESAAELSSADTPAEGTTNDETAATSTTEPTAADRPAPAARMPIPQNP